MPLARPVPSKNSFTLSIQLQPFERRSSAEIEADDLAAPVEADALN
jgi:hypothetical protein